MGLLYINEHHNCYNFSALSTALFYLHIGSKKNTKYDIDRSVIIYVLKGSIIISTGEYRDQIVNSKELCLLPRGSVVYSRSLTDDTFLISCTFIVDSEMCNKFSLQQLVNFLPQEYFYKFTTLPTCNVLDQFYDLAKGTLSDGLGCVHYHELLKKQLFLYLRMYYSKEDLAEFFHPIIGNNFDFKDFIMGNHKEAPSIEYLADKANMSLSTFNRKFKSVFNESAHKWIGKRKAERIYADIVTSNKSIVEIAYEHGFSSQAYLTAFCKKHFNKTPMKLKQKSE